MCAVGFVALLWGGGLILISRHAIGAIAGFLLVILSLVILAHGFRA
jgi:hypothetical protein